MSETKEEFRAYMDTRLANVLARLSAGAAAYQPTVAPVGQRPAPDPKPSVADYPELEADQVNNSTANTSEQKRVVISPAPPGVPAGGSFSLGPEIVNDVPLVQSRPAEGIDHQTPVQSTLAGIDGAKVHFSNVVKQANTNLRSEGDLAANIAVTLGQDAVESTEATVTAVSGRIATARIAVRKGALASRLPTQGMDVRLSTLRTVATDQRNYPEYVPVYIPSGLSDAGGAALVSLMVVGGPGAYVWRYPAASDIDPGIQPAGVRWRWPGGADRMLVVTEDDRDWNVVFGGAAFSNAALTEVENYYRRAWGDGIFDEGWRTSFALTGVYARPRDFPKQLGLDFQAKRTTQRWRIDGEDVDGNPAWDGPAVIPPPPDANTRGVFTNIPPSAAAQLGRVAYRAWVAAFGDAFPPEARPNADQYASHTIDRRGILYTDVGGHIWVAEWAQLTADELGDDVLLPVLRLASRAVLHVPFGEGLIVDDEAPEFNPETNPVRNVFGQNDRAVLLLPRLRVSSVLALLAGISVTVPSLPVQRYLDDTNMETVTTAFGAHLHFSFIMSLSRQHLEPAVLRVVPLPGAVGMLGVPKTLRGLCVPRMMSEEEYETGGLECLENGAIFQTFRNTPYAGFAVDGVWANNMGIVDVADPGNSYAGMDAAFRTTWLSGGRIDVHTRLQPHTQIGVIFGAEGLVNPFAVPRFVRGVRGVEGLRVQAGAGLNALVAGRSIDAFLWSSY